MPVRNQNWYDLQAGRRYPLNDRSTGIDDAGNSIRDSILVDCNIRYPKTYGPVAFVQAVTVSAGIVTVVIGAADDENATTSTPIAAISAPKPLQLNKNYAVQALVPGVAGWCVFGDGVSENFTARYSSPRQTLLLENNARAYSALPVTSIGKYGVGTSLAGLVNIVTAAPLVTELREIQVNGKTTQALVFGLDATVGLIGYNPLKFFLGPCSQRPESGTCPQTPIESINGITPDCDGNINILSGTADLTVVPFADCGGFGLYLDIDLPEICGKRPYETPREGVDQCETSSSSAGA